MSLKINSKDILIVLQITICYWYRLFTAGSSVLGKSNLHMIITFCTFLISLTLHSTKYCTKIKEKKKLIFSTLFCFIFLFFYGMLSAIWAADRGLAFNSSIIYLVTGLSTVTIALLINDKLDAIFTCKIILINTIITCAISAYEGFTGKYIFGYTSLNYATQWVYMNFHSPLSQYNHPNNLATVLVLSLPFCIVAINQKRKNYFKSFCLIAVVSFVVFIAQSRFSMVMIFAQLALIFLGNKSLSKKTLFILIITILGALFLGAYKDGIIAFAGNLTVEARPLIWKNALDNVFKSHFMGVGAGNAYLVNSRTATASFIGRPCHNYFLEILEEFGIIGLFVFIKWYSIILSGIRHMRTSFLKTVAFVFFIAFLPMSIEQSSLLGSQTVWMFFGVSLGILLTDVSFKKGE